MTPTLFAYGEAYPRNAQYRPGGEDCQPLNLSAIRESRKRARQTETCKKEAEEYRQNTNDLIQQTRAADAAQAQADIASQQLWTGWLQTLGGFLTLAAAVGAAIYARDAATETRQGAMQARRAAQAAEDALTQGQSGQRAWLLPTIEIIFNKNPNGTVSAMFHPRWTNYGQTPALRGTVSHKGDPDILTDDEFRATERSNIAIGPDQYDTAQPYVIDMQEMYDWDRTYRARCLFEYFDIFDPNTPHLSEFVYNVRYIGHFDPVANVEQLTGHNFYVRIELRTTT